MNTNDILESLNMAAVSKNGIHNALLHEIADALKERDALREQLDGINEAYATVINERCASDEVHCTCVPFLRMEIDRLRESLATIALHTDDDVVLAFVNAALEDK